MIGLSILTIFLAFLLAIVALSLIVLAHEFGHFIVAKKSGVWVEEFGMGLPPRMWGKKVGETIYSINWLPIGGFVKLHGEASDEGVTQPKRAFVNASMRVKVAVALAGIVMNYVFAILVFALLNIHTGIPSGNELVGIIEVAPGSPAEQAGIENGDVLLAVDGIYAQSTDQMLDLLAERRGEVSSLVVQKGVERGSDIVESSALVREDPPENEGSLGVVIASFDEFYKPPIWQMPFVYLYHGVLTSWDYTKVIVTGFASMFVQVRHGETPQGVAGPVGIVAIITEIVRRFGILSLMEFSAIISINLAIINLVPFPPLDGSRVVFSLFEGVFGKTKLAVWEERIHAGGMVIILLLLFILTATEIPKIIGAGGFSGFVDGLVGL